MSARDQFEQAARDLEAALRSGTDALAAVRLARENYSSSRLAYSIERRQAGITTFELTCPACYGVAGEFDHAEHASRYDQQTWHCNDCGAKGKIDVDGDEDGCHVSFIVDKQRGGP